MREIIVAYTTMESNVRTNTIDGYIKLPVSESIVFILELIARFKDKSAPCIKKEYNKILKLIWEAVENVVRLQGYQLKEFGTIELIAIANV